MNKLNIIRNHKLHSSECTMNRYGHCHDCKANELISRIKYICLKCNSIINLLSMDYFAVGSCFGTSISVNWVVFLCPSCLKISINEASGEYIAMIPNAHPEINEIINNISNKDLVFLFKEFTKCVELKINSAGTLLARKILMHIAINESAKENKDFLYYVDFIQNSGLIGKNWNKVIGIIRKLGNEENHKFKMASDHEIKIILELFKVLIKNIYEPSLHLAKLDK